MSYNKRQRRCSIYKDHIKLFRTIISSNSKFKAEDIAEQVICNYFNQFKLLQKVINCSMEKISVLKLTKKNIYFEIVFKNNNARDNFIENVDLMSFPFFGEEYTPIVCEIDEHIINLCFEN